MTEHYGYAGKILIVNLTDRTSQTIDTEPYIEWVGGHGMASKLFWDYCEDKTVEAVDPGNVLVFAATPFSGAVVPAASSSRASARSRCPNGTTAPAWAAVWPA